MNYNTLGIFLDPNNVVLMAIVDILAHNMGKMFFGVIAWPVIKKQIR